MTTRPFALPNLLAARWMLAGAGLCAGWAIGADAAAAPAAPASAPAAPAAPAFGFDDVALRALASANKPYQAPATVLPAELKQLDYDQYRDIRFRPDRALWRNEQRPFELAFFHLGFYQTQSVAVYTVDERGARPLPFDGAAFDYGKNTLSPKSWGDVRYAGFRIHYPLNTPAYKDELAVFLGASYFRAIGAGQHYGLSARGLGIDTVGGSGEEFPRFTSFWIVKPAFDARRITMYAQLDSPRATGAYEFVFTPGETTVADVRMRIYLRAPVATLGIAPLTSMFLHGENDPTRGGDFRPEVHDSDGLMIATQDATGNAEWLWRPLIHPKRALATAYTAQRLVGFGLMQRDRAYTNYEDTEALYEKRPSAWVEPVGDWGPGRVEMLQLPIPDETHDNIVAYWVPAQQPAPGQPLDLRYRLHWQSTQQQLPPNGWTLQSRRGRSMQPLGENEFQYLVDFTGPALNALAADAPVKAVVSANEFAKITETNAYRNPVNGTWRMALRGQRLDKSQPVELRAFLQQGSNALTETWTSLIPAD